VFTGSREIFLIWCNERVPRVIYIYEWPCLSPSHTLVHVHALRFTDSRSLSLSLSLSSSIYAVNNILNFCTRTNYCWLARRSADTRFYPVLFFPSPPPRCIPGRNIDAENWSIVSPMRIRSGSNNQGALKTRSLLRSRETSLQCVSRLGPRAFSRLLTIAISRDVSLEVRRFMNVNKSSRSDQNAPSNEWFRVFREMPSGVARQRLLGV